MRKSGWAAAAGLVSAALLLTACGGGGSSTTGASSTGGATPSTGAAATNTPDASSNGTGASPKASSSLSSPPPGTVYFYVQKSSAGYVLVEHGKPVYTFAGDTKGKAATCTGGCASTWPPVMAMNPLVSQADSTLPGTLGQINGQATWNALPLYTHAGGKDLAVYQSSQWKLIILSKSDIKTA